MKRRIISIDHDKCNGCGLCIPDCPEGAIQMINGKARLVSDLFCDGLGACLGACPEGAITIREREAEPYDETTVMAHIIPQGKAVIRAHLSHLLEHGEEKLYRIACAMLEKNGLPNPVLATTPSDIRHQGCPGSRSMVLGWNEAGSDSRPASASAENRPSRLETWPVQLHLIPPRAPHFRGRELLLSADCAAYTAGDFHRDHLAGRVLAIACPKLDDGQEIYLEKLIALIDEAEIASLTVLTMEVPCCNGLAQLAKQALDQARRHDVPLTWKVLNIRGEVIRREEYTAIRAKKPVSYQ
ncbi:MAG TPA: 4Fe-4S dicluster domain-containing protein [Spirochaetia bacterium]|nr:4Fe-4S dicluster domain-containing protein [Spirochaetia bacterium]